MKNIWIERIPMVLLAGMLLQVSIEAAEAIRESLVSHQVISPVTVSGPTKTAWVQLSRDIRTSVRPNALRTKAQMFSSPKAY